jgi:hypothetical protein
MPNRAEGDRAASVSIERGRCYARVFTRGLAWNGKKHFNFHAVRCDRVCEERVCKNSEASPENGDLHDEDSVTVCFR